VRPIRPELLRVKHLGMHQPAATVICRRLLDPKWKLEIEGMF
jgi:hypothetical protein